jgi:beta-glucanase (GH16 family)
MLPTDWVYGGWAGSGELDIMEVVNLKTESDDPDYAGLPEGRVHGTLHYGRKSPENIYTGTYTYLQNNDNPADDFHEYAVEWEEDEIRWYIDDIHFATQTSDSWYTQYMKDGKLVTGEGAAPFDQKFHLILNFALGGNWAGNVNEKGVDKSVFPQTFDIDYVRVYQCNVNTETGKGCAAKDDAAKLVIGAPQPEL